ncbi:acidic nuclear phosphoprotein 32 family, member B, isoform CRA_b [Rattus norvegicus]|uniref:Acidic nuclear phosphoprotein 32 family, member B, isoform CRA_b n=1 Tax=Rattus norvegicus TaxID=10116 RepID=A6IJC0_RAT|nr:acidic nuclear phosphoprotein 32 family, member B, isoform CRA_b [Rattus norvegicus]
MVWTKRKRMKRRKKVGKVKREREKQMTKEKMTKPRDSLQDTELLSMVGLLMDLVAVLKR